MTPAGITPEKFGAASFLRIQSNTFCGGSPHASALLRPVAGDASWVFLVKLGKETIPICLRVHVTPTDAVIGAK